MRLSLAWKFNRNLLFKTFKLAQTIDIHQKTVSSTIFSDQNFRDWVNVRMWFFFVSELPCASVFSWSNGTCFVDVGTFVISNRFVYLMEAIYKRIPIRHNPKIDVLKAQGIKFRKPPTWMMRIAFVYINPLKNIWKALNSHYQSMNAQKMKPNRFSMFSCLVQSNENW